MKVKCVCLILWFALAAGALAQSQSRTSVPKPTQNTGAAPATKEDVVPAGVVPVEQEPAHHLIFENQYVRVFSVEVAPHAGTLFHRHDRDYVYAVLGDATIQQVLAGRERWPVTYPIAKGSIGYSKGGLTHKVASIGKEPFRNVTVELKRGLGRVLSDCTHGVTVCVSEQWPQPHPENFFGREILLNTDKVKVSRWRITYKNFPIPVLLYRHLMIPLGEFLLEEGAHHPGSRVFKPGEAVWVAELGEHDWGPEPDVDTEFITIEFKEEPGGVRAREMQNPQ